MRYAMIAESDTFQLAPRHSHTHVKFQLALVASTSTNRPTDRQTKSTTVSQAGPRHKVSYSSRLISSLPRPTKRTLANWTGAEACATPEKMRTRRKRKRPKRSRPCKANGRSEKKVSSTRGSVHRVRRMIRLHSSSQTGGSRQARIEPTQAKPDRRMAKWKSSVWTPPSGHKLAVPLCQSLSACGAHPLSLSSL